MATNTIGQTGYSSSEKMLELAKKHFGDTEVIKAGIVGYTTEATALVHQDGMSHRTLMYDELFKSTAKLPSSINRYASWQKWEIPQATPSYSVVSLAIPYDILKEKLEVMTSVVIPRKDYVDIGGFPFSVPYDVIITETNGNVTARMDISSNMTALSSDVKIKYQNNPYIQVAIRALSEVDPSINSSKKYVYLMLDVYQYELMEQVWEHYNAKDSIDRAMYYDGEYRDQLVKFDILHNGTLIDKFYNFNESSSQMYCYYSYTTNGKISIIFDNKSTFKPTFGSILKAEYCISKGSQANFTFTGTPYFKFSANELADIETFVTILKEPSGGKDKMSLPEIRKQLAILDLSRDSLTTEYDLENYFQNLLNEQTTSSINLKFFKKRDDIIKRIFYSFILFRDPNGVIIPTTTANIVMPFSEIEMRNNFIPAGTLFKYDYSKKKIREIYSEEFQDVIREQYGDLFYMTPFAMKFNFSRFDNIEYIDMFRNESILTKYIPDAAKTAKTTDIIINNFEFKRDPLTSVDYLCSIPFMMTNTDGINIPLDVRMTISFLEAGSKIVRANKALKFNPTTNKFECIFKSGDRFNNQSELLINDLNNMQTGETVAYIPEKLTIRVDTEIKEDNIWKSSSSFESSDLASPFFRNMSIACKSTLSHDDKGNIQVADVPFIGANFGLNSANFGNFITHFNPLVDILVDSINRIENSTEVDIKFFNTYGISRDYNVPMTNIAMTMRIKLEGTYTKELTEQIRAEVIRLIASETTERNVISFSHIISELTKKFSNIGYIVPIGFNHSTVCNGGADVIKPLDTVTAEQTINSFTDRPPEFINLNNVYRYGTNTPDLVIDFI